MLANRIDLRSYHSENCSHTHEYAQLVLPLLGSMELEVGHYSGVVDENIGVYIAPNEHHCFAGSQHNLFLVIDLMERNYLVQSDLTPHAFNVTASTKKLLHFTHHYLTHNERDFVTDSLINQLLCHVTAKSGMSQLDRAVMNAKDWIDRHCAEPVSVERVARHCHLSVSQLQRRFKSNMGCGIAEYWRMKKLHQAKSLLAISTLPIEAIAFDLGYENLSAFSRRFSKVFGEPPSQWRNKQLAAQKMRETDN